MRQQTAKAPSKMIVPGGDDVCFDQAAFLQRSSAPTETRFLRSTRTTRRGFQIVEGKSLGFKADDTERSEWLSPNLEIERDLRVGCLRWVGKDLREKNRGLTDDPNINLYLYLTLYLSLSPDC